MRMRNAFLASLALCCALLSPRPLGAQGDPAHRLLIVGADARGLPTLHVRLGLFDGQGEPVRDLRPDEVSVRIDGRPITATLELAPEPQELALVVVADLSAAMGDQNALGETRIGVMGEQVGRLSELLAPGRTPVSLVTFAGQAQVASDWSVDTGRLRGTLAALASQPLPPAEQGAPYALLDAIRLGLEQFRKPDAALELEQRPRALVVYAAGSPGTSFDNAALQSLLDDLRPNVPAITIVGLGSSEAGQFGTQPGDPASLSQLAEALPGAVFLPFFYGGTNDKALLQNALDARYERILDAEQLLRLSLGTDTLDPAIVAPGRHRIEISARDGEASVVTTIEELPPLPALRVPDSTLRSRARLSVEILFAQRPVQQVEYFLDGHPIGVATGGPDFPLELDVAGLYGEGDVLGERPGPGHTYRLTATATDSAGLSRESEERLVTLEGPPNTLPVYLIALGLVLVAGVAGGALIIVGRARATPLPPSGAREPQERILDTRTVVGLASDGGRTAVGQAVTQVVVFDGAEPVPYSLTLGRPLLVGRSSQHDIPLTNQRVSRNHARLAVVAGGVELTDLGSANGTFVGESRRRLEARKPAVLGPGEVAWIGPEVRIVVGAGRGP